MLVAITSFWMWAGVQVWLRGSLFDVSDGRNLAILGALFIVLLSLLSVGFIIFQNRLWSVYFSLIVCGTFLALFRLSNINLVGFFILVFLFYQAQDIVIGEALERIKINPRLLVKKSLASLVLAFFVLISFAAYESTGIEQFNNIQKLPSSSEVFIKTIVEQTLGGQLAEASPQQKDLVFSQVTQEVIREANTFLGPYFEYAPPALAFGLFLVLWGVGWIFIWLSVFAGMGIFWILKRVKFFRVEEYNIKAERLVI